MSDYETLELLIDGQWTTGTSGATRSVENPATEETLGELPLASKDDLDAALAASERGFAAWRATPAVKRQVWWRRWARRSAT